jgi:hypothetical protein
MMMTGCANRQSDQVECLVILLDQVLPPTATARVCSWQNSRPPKLADGVRFLGEAMTGHVLAEGQLIGTYERQPMNGAKQGPTIRSPRSTAFYLLSCRLPCCVRSVVADAANGCQVCRRYL